MLCAMAVANPLLSDTFPIPFDAIGAEHVEPAFDVLLADSRARIDSLCEVEPPGTFESVMLALEDATADLERALRVVGHLEGVATSPALRDAYSKARPRVVELLSGLPLNEPLWRVIKAYADSDEAAQLPPTRRRFVDKTRAYFARHGADLDAAGKARLAEIDLALTRKCLRYSQNVLDATHAFELLVQDEERLAGLPDRAKRAARQSAEEKGLAGWRFTLQAPSYIAALTYLDDGELRERLYRGMATRATSAPHDNRELVRQLLQLRQAKAKLLGFASFVDLVTEERMAKSGAQARAFVDDLSRRTRPHFEREKAELLAFRREIEGADAAELQPWDVAYYAEKQRRAVTHFDEEALRPFFPFEKVLEGAFGIAQHLYGVRFEPWDDAPRWHQDVRAYRVVNEEDDAWLAGIYVDPYPRTTKQGGAWMDGVVGRGRREGDARHVGVLVANVSPPVGGEDALLAHRDVETLFHELGHLMHHCLGSAELRSQAGTQVAWDFVELPSQILENWCWEREALDRFARHHQTGEPIGEELHASMRRARTFHAASQQMRQLGFAALDLTLHIDWSFERDGEPLGYARAVLADYWPTPLPSDHALIAAFDHLFGDPVGYAGGYYSYKWAEVLDADAFTRFRERGPLDRATGMEFRRAILARGDEEEPEVLFRDFMGRDPQLDALLERLGLAPQ